MKYKSVCSGVESATLAWKHLGWEATSFAEIDKFPSAVLAHHWPNIINHEDFTKIQEEDEDYDLLVGGTPCQGFSIAGLRKGLDDDRSNLAIEFVKLVERDQPRWVVWENVPGALSTWSGEPETDEGEWEEKSDFDQFLKALQECGYGIAYRILDAQYIRVDGFGRAVPQRRRRVFVVGYLGDWRPATAVLLERESLCGNPAPSRKAGQGIAGGFEVGPSGGGEQGLDYVVCRESGQGYWKKDEVSGTVKVNMAEPTLAVCYENHPSDSRVVEHGDLCPTIPARAGTGGGNLPLVAIPINTQIATRHNKLGRETGLGISEDGDPAYTLQAAHSHAVAFQPKASVTQSMNPSEICPTIDTCKTPAVMEHMQVRRLTPIECERLMGFPDNHTRIPWRGKPAEQCPDGPRYKACGNSMCVNVMRWLGTRIQMVEDLMVPQKAESIETDDAYDAYMMPFSF